MKKKLQRLGKPSVDLLEEAVHRLRSAPLSVVLSYYIGTLPFLLSLLYFIADMSRSVFAENHAFEYAGVMAFLFLWMKTWHSVFTRGMKGRLADDTENPLTFRQFLRIAWAQTILQPLSLFFLPISLVIVFPFAWVYAFYQNTTVFADGETADTREILKRAWTQAKLWPGQNHVVLFLLSALALVVFIDLGVLVLILPELLKTLFGVETVFTFSGYAVLNTTLLAIVCAMSYACLDPLVKTIYVLRCYYGESIQSGEDLKTEMRQIKIPSRIAIAVLLFALLHTQAAAVFAGGSSEASTQQKLDQTINKVVQKREFQWRLPREKKPVVANDNIVVRYLEKMLQMTVDVFRALQRWYDRFMKWIRDILPNRSDSEESGPAGKGNYRLLLILIGVVLVLLGIVLWQLRKRRKKTAIAAEAVPSAVPDLADEDVTADQLPEEGWQSMAQDLFQRGETRLALRALYLGGLAFLAGRNLLSIARYKSNRDYLNELRRRAHELPALQQVFSENVFVFERSWYGNHEVTSEVFQSFSGNSSRMRTLAQE